MWPKAPIINHIVRQWCVTLGPQVNKDNPTRQDDQRPRDYPLGAKDQGWISLLCSCSATSVVSDSLQPYGL